MDKHESELLNAVKKGDEGAFDRLFTEYREMVFRIAYGVVREHGAAQDISQEVFLRLHKYMAGFKEKSSLRTWIYRISLNTAIRHSKKRPFLPLFDALFEKIGGQDPSQEAQRSELEERLFKAMDCLSVRQKKAFILKNQEGLKYSEISEIMNISPGTVKAMIYQGVQKLRAEMAGEEDEYI